MKRYILCLYLLSASLIAFCQTQKPEYDTITNNIAGWRPEYKDVYARSTVSIKTLSESGQGLLIGTNLVLTSYSLVAGKSGVSYSDASGRTKYFTGYIAADPARGIVLLKTEDVYSEFINLTYSNISGSPSFYEQQICLMHKDGNRFLVEKAVLPYSEESKGDYKKKAYVPRKVSYSGTRPIQGYIDFDSYMIFAGMIVYINEEPFHINNRPLYELSLYRDMAPNNLADLPLLSSFSQTQKSKPSIYKIGLLSDDNVQSKTKSDILTLDYVKKDQQKLSFYFTFKPIDWTTGASFNPNLRMIDLKSGIIYHPSSIDNAGYVYNSTTSQTAVHFEKIPASANHVKLFNLPDDVYEYDKELRKITIYTTRKFFSDVIINNFPTTKKTHYDLDEDYSNYGTVSFYCLKSSNITDNVSISIDGNAVGSITKYYTDTNITDFCGRSSTVTVKLKQGEYKYKAVMRGNKIERKFIVTKGKCLGQLIKF